MLMEFKTNKINETPICPVIQLKQIGKINVKRGCKIKAATNVRHEPTPRSETVKKLT